MLKLGYLLPTRENILRGEHSTRGLLDAARQAQALGFDSIWVGDSLLARPRHDPLTLLAAIASVVSDVDLGTAVLLPALRNPVVLAQQLATIDQISEGRLIIGAGIAADTPAVRAEFTAASVPFEKRVGRLVEGLQLCRALWTGEPVNWAGRWLVTDATLAPKPFRDGGPPIWLASGVGAGIRRAAKHFDGWFPIGPNAEVFQSQHNLFVEAALEFKRPSPTTAIYLTVCIGSEAEQPNQQIDRYLAEYYGAPPQILRTIQACCGGTLEEVLEFIRSFVICGADHIVLRVVGNHEHALHDIAKHRDQLS